MANGTPDPTEPIRQIDAETLYASTFPHFPAGTVTPEQLEQRAQLQGRQPQPNHLADLNLRNVAGGYPGREDR